MTRLLRFVALIACLFGGYLIGSMIGRLALIPFVAVAHIDKTFASIITIAAKVRYYDGPEFRGLFTDA